MSGKTPITVCGNAVDDPELRFLPSGVPVANLRIASTSRKFNKDTQAWEDDSTLFLKVSVWREQAENVAETVKRGMRLVITGNLTQKQFEKKDGSKGSSYEIEDAEVAVSLSRATAVVTKTTGQGGQRQQPAQSGYGQQQPAHDPWNTSVPQQRQDEPPF